MKFKVQKRKFKVYFAAPVHGWLMKADLRLFSLPSTHLWRGGLGRGGVSPSEAALHEPAMALVGAGR
jgi:hypothetical protein